MLRDHWYAIDPTMPVAQNAPTDFSLLALTYAATDATPVGPLMPSDIAG